MTTQRLFCIPFLFASVLACAASNTRQDNAAGPAEENLIRIRSSLIALKHVQIIDGTGAPAKPDQTILISAGRIAAIADTHAMQIPPNTETLDLSGYSALPGLVGMHDHLFYVTGQVNDNYLAHDMPLSFPRLFLANGVTTIRTAGSYEPYTDLEIKRAVDRGKMIGPKINVTGPYLVDGVFGQIQIHALAGAEDARRTVDYWADEGMTSFKAYEYISRAELKAAIEAVHKRGLTIAGHLCSIGFREAAELGIDSLEHGLFVDTEFDPNKQPDVCPENDWPALVSFEVNSEQVRQTIDSLIKHHVAVTSTLPIIEHSLPSWAGAPQQALDSLDEDALKSYQEYRLQKSREAADNGKRQETRRFAEMFRKEMQFELAFVRAGGLLMAGSDAVLVGGIAGFADLREIELLVEAGFAPPEAVRIASLNGAQFLKQDHQIGSLAVGKQADIVIVKGDPSKHIQDIEKVEVVFKDGVGYDSRKLIESVKGQVGIR
jgi:imidazolonepropionase-like amidohydrolase